MTNFVWDVRKEFVNIHKHGVDFVTAAKAFLDPNRKIYIDSRHGGREERYFCLGKVGGRVFTVRFVSRGGGRLYYEKKDT